MIRACMRWARGSLGLPATMLKSVALGALQDLECVRLGIHVHHARFGLRLGTAITCAFATFYALVVSSPAIAAPTILGISWGNPGARIYDIDPATGATSNERRIRNSAGGSDLAPFAGLSFDAQGILYALKMQGTGHGAHSLWTLDPANEEATLIGNIGLRVFEGDLDFDLSTGKLYGLVDVPEADPTKRNLFEINKATGAGTVIGSVAVQGNLAAMAFNQAGDLYVLDANATQTSNGRLLKIDKTDGSILDQVELSAPLGATAGMDFAPTGVLFVVEGGGSLTNDTYKLHTLSLDTGHVAEIGPLGLAFGASALEFTAYDPSSGDLRLSQDDVQRWFIAERPVRAGNEVVPLIDGPATFTAMKDAIDTAVGLDSYIYFLNWWWQDNFRLVPSQSGSTLKLLLHTANLTNAEIRAMFWEPFTGRHADEVRRINKLTNGKAVRDQTQKGFLFGSHHQKLLVVNGTQGLVGFCGGIDFNADRVWETSERPNVGSTKGAPLHDVHCQIRGPAAFDLLKVFRERWFAHPRVLGNLRGSATGVPDTIQGATVWAQVGRTYAKGKMRPFAGNDGERTAAKMILKGIEEAKEFIYVEDQYFLPTMPNTAGLDIETALKDAIKKPDFKFLIILVPHQKISDVPQGNLRRKPFIESLQSAEGGEKVHVYNLKIDKNLDSRVDRHTYVHSKMWIFDDQYAIIGSANLNRRSFTHDSEVVVGFVDQGSPSCDRFWVARQLRMNLWKEHLNIDIAMLRDAVTAAPLWDSAVGRLVERLDLNVNLQEAQWNLLSPAKRDQFWDEADPDGS